MFRVIKKCKDAKAREGIFKTPYGMVKTPAFFPVATQGAVKGLSPKDLAQIGIEGLLVNAYHLYLRPGVDVVEDAGGLHKFMGFYGPLITDSGGYQILSLAKLRKVEDAGVTFQSHIDGSLKFLSPADVMDIQLRLGADVVVPLDECIKAPASREDAARSVQRTIRWARICRDVFEKRSNKEIMFFGILQGANFLDLREECLKGILGLGIDGIAIGGLSVGEDQGVRYDILSLLESKLDDKYLRYFMGYGQPQDILEAVSRGIDLFDCIIPTRFARTGTAFTGEGRIVVRDASFCHDRLPLDRDCHCYVCNNFSRSYIRHLVNVKEMLGFWLLTYHNLFWYNKFMADIRQAIENDSFRKFKNNFLAKFKDNSKQANHLLTLK